MSNGNLKVGIEDKLPLGQTLVGGLQHLSLIISTPFVVPMMMAAAFPLPGDSANYLVCIMLIAAGLITLTQSAILLKLPIPQGQSFFPLILLIAAVPVYGLSVTYTGMILGWLASLFLTIPFKRGLLGQLKPFLTPPPVYGTLMLLIGLSMLPSIATPMITRGDPAGLSVRVLLALVAIFVPWAISAYAKKPWLKFGSIFIGLVAGTLVAWPFGLLDFSAVSTAPWFFVPRLFPFGFTLEPFGGVLVVAISMFLASLCTMAEAVGVYQTLCDMGGQELTMERVNKGQFGETLGSIIMGCFGSVPTTTFAQNIGVIGLTGVGARITVTACGLMLIACGFLYKLAVFVTKIPQAVYGGSRILVFGLLVVVGIDIIRKMEFNEVNKLVVGLGVGVGVGAMGIPANILASLPPAANMIIGSPALVGFIVAWLTHIILVQLKARKAAAAKAAAATQAGD